MSAYIVSNKTANHIISVLVDLEYIDISEAQCFLNMMMAINTKSVNTRYEETEAAPEYIFEQQVTGFYDENDCMPSLLALNLIGNFNYQSCEFDGYKNSIICRTLSDVDYLLTKQAKGWLIHEGYTAEELNGKKYYDLPCSGDVKWEHY